MGVLDRRTKRTRAADLGIAQRLGRSFRAVAALVALALAITMATTAVVLRIDQPSLDSNTDGRSGARLAHQGMLDQETGVRGWLLTGDATFLQPYQSGLSEMHGGDAQVDDNLGQNSTLAPLILQVRLAEQSWSDGWARPLATSPPPKGGVSEAMLATGKKLFDSYRTLDDRLTTAISGDYDATRRNERITLRVSAGLEILLFAAVLVLTVREHRRLRAALVAPFSALQGVMQRVQHGDLEARVAEEGPADLRELATGLNQMIGALAQERSLRASRETEVMFQASKLAEVLEMARNLAGSLNLRYVVEATATHAVSVSGFDMATVWLLDEDQQVLTALHAATRDNATLDAGEPREILEVNQGCVGHAARYGRVQTSRGDGVGDPPGAVSVMCVPMIVGARVVGVIELASTRDYAMPPAALGIAETLASHAGTAIEAARLHQRTEELSQVDALTRLFNRRRFEADIDREVKSSRRYDRPMAFCMLDVDHFKRYNDRFGHQRGDEVLEEVARLLRTGIRASDSAYRYGGEEFCLLLRDTPLAAAVALCERLRTRISGRFGHEEGITASFGVAALDEHMRTPADLVEAADRALYRAKAAGRDRVVDTTQAGGGGDVLTLRPS